MNDTQKTSQSHQEILRDIGNRLHEGRSLKRMSQEEVAANLKLSLSQVKGLETGDWSFLPDGIYALGFLRQYATMVGVDVAAEVYQLKTELSLKQPVTIPDPAIAPNRRWTIFSLLLLLALAAYFNLQQNNDESSVSIVTTKVASSSITRVEQPATQKEDALIHPLTSNNATAIEPYSNQETIALPKQANNDDGMIHHLLLTAVGGDVWLSVSTVAAEDKPTRKLKEMLLRDGQTVIIDTTEKNLLLTAGNAIALSIRIDDVIRYPAGTLAADGKVLRKFFLNLLAS